MKNITVRLYEELNDYLPVKIRKSPLKMKIPDHTPVIRLIQRLAIPEDEVDLILINSQPAGLETQINDDDYISVYPEFESFDISRLQHIHDKPLRKTRFILHEDFPELQNLLNRAGYDCRNGNDYSEEELVRTSNSEKRIIITREKYFMHKLNINRCYCLKADTPEKQLSEIQKRFDL